MTLVKNFFLGFLKNFPWMHPTCPGHPTGTSTGPPRCPRNGPRSGRTGRGSTGEADQGKLVARFSFVHGSAGASPMRLVRVFMLVLLAGCLARGPLAVAQSEGPAGSHEQAVRRLAEAGLKSG